MTTRPTWPHYDAVKAKPLAHRTRRFEPLLAISLGFALASAVTAATKTWNTTSGSLSGSTSWSPTGTPLTTDEVVFDGTVTPAASISSAASSNPTFGNFIWNNNTSSTLQMNTTSNTSAFIRLSGGGGFTAAVAAGGAAGDLIVMGTNAADNTLTVSAININAAPGTALLRFRLDNSGNFNVVNAGAHLNIGTAINESGVRTLTKTGAGRLTLGAANTFSGGVVLSSGTLALGSPLALGSGGLTLNGGTLASVTSVRTITNPVTVGGDFTLGGLGQSLTINGTVDLGASSRIITLNDSATIGSEISNGALTVEAGSRTLTLSGNSTYDGATFVSSGTLLLTGALDNTAVSVGASGTIGGTGSLNGSLAFDGNSTLTVADLTDALTIAGSVTFASGFGINNLTGIDWDALDFDTPYTILNNGTDFSAAGLDNFGLANAVSIGALGRQAYFQTGSLQVVVIPEPTAALLGSLGLLALLRRRRRI